MKQSIPLQNGNSKLQYEKITILHCFSHIEVYCSNFQVYYSHSKCLMLKQLYSLIIKLLTNLMIEQVFTDYKASCKVHHNFTVKLLILLKQNLIQEGFQS